MGKQGRRRCSSCADGDAPQGLHPSGEDHLTSIISAFRNAWCTRAARRPGHFQVYKSLARLTKPPLNRSMPADRKLKDFEPRRPKKSLEASAALSMANTVKDTAKSRRVSILAADGVEGGTVEAMKRAMTMGAMAPSARWVRSSSRRSRATALGAGNLRGSAFPCT